jgi:hypothetical protein
MSDERQVAMREPMELGIEQLQTQVQTIQRVMSAIMKEGEHYGVIPGTDKPTLLKPGAEKLGMTFRLAPVYAIDKRDLPNGHREYEITCTLTHIATGAMVGQGVGICTTMESKYRYRKDAAFEVLDDPIPNDAKENKAEYRKQGFGMRKVDGAWCWVKYGKDERIENPDIADTYNTVLKMAKKRAHVDAILTATAASDIFAQDIEDLPNMPDMRGPEDDPRKRAERCATSGYLTEDELKEYRARLQGASREKAEQVIKEMENKCHTRADLDAVAEGTIDVTSDDEPDLPPDSYPDPEGIL